jgi:hypothetical protein
VEDKLTALIWLQNANGFGLQTWLNALNTAHSLADGQCGLSDGSMAGEWRLPNVKELQSLIDFGSFDPALPTSHPFSGVQFAPYWSSTTLAKVLNLAWYVRLDSGRPDADRKGIALGRVWPVRGGH